MTWPHSNNTPPPTLLDLAGTNLAALERSLGILPWSDFYAEADDFWFAYRATSAAVVTFGHADIAHMILRMTPHGAVGEAAGVQLDRIPFTGLSEHLILLRLADEPAIHALTETEYRAAMQRLVS